MIMKLWMQHHFFYNKKNLNKIEFQHAKVCFCGEYRARTDDLYAASVAL